MNVVFLIIAIIIWLIGEIILCKKLNSKFYFIIIFMFSASLYFILLTISNIYKDKGALEVYRNNTELKITYEIVNNDTISCDSVVIFKK